MRMITTLKLSIFSLLSLIISAFFIDYLNVHNELFFTILGSLIFLFSVFVWFFPICVIWGRKEVKSRIGLTLLTLSIPVFGGVICYFILKSKLH